MPAVADTSYVIALAVATQTGHRLCLEVHRKQDLIYLPQTTLTEVAYLLTREGGNQLASRFILGLPQTKYRIEALTPADLQCTGELLQVYADSRVDFVDATVAAVAERKQIDTILTLDRRDFGIIRPRHCEYFTLLLPL
jgi:predicted nucleic acid-binding protein